MLNSRSRSVVSLFARLALTLVLALALCNLVPTPAAGAPTSGEEAAGAQPRGRRGAQDDKKPEPPKTERFARPRTFNVTHVRTELEPDFAKQSIRVVVEHTLTPIVPAINEVAFDQVGFDFEGVQVNGNAVEFRTGKDNITIPLGRWVKPGEVLKVRMTYTARPKNGMFFLVNDGIDPDASSTQLHTQGEPELNRHWLCCYDSPNDKVTSDMTLTVPAGMVGLSNGKLVNKEDLADGRHRFHWSEQIAMSTYLISVVVGHFDEVTDKWRDRPVTYWVPPGYAPAAKLTFGNTPKMLEFFSNYVGVDYPWEKYDQTIIWRFRYGGMENTSLTNMTSRLLHDERAHADGERNDSIVAHELGHQWFGDMVTMRSWAHLWLNEGFATYCESLWTEHADGPDSMAWRMDRNRGAFGWADNRNPEPIVRHGYNNPHELFDGRTYQKGSWVLHMLRQQIGAEKFRAVLKEWVSTYRVADANPVTHDLRRVAERVSGQDLGGFFQQWLYRGGWPKLDVSWKHEDGKLWVTVKQTQEVKEMWPLFTFPLSLGIVKEDGTEATERIRVSRAEETFVLPLDYVPVRLRVDPGHNVLRELAMNQPDENGLEQLRKDPDVIARREALHHYVEAAKKAEKGDERQRLCAVVLSAVNDRFDQLQREALNSVRGLVNDNKWSDDPANPLAALLMTMMTNEKENSDVRSTAIGTLARLHHRPAYDFIRETALNGHTSYNVHEAALRALPTVDGDKALPALRLALNIDSHRDAIRRAALDSICGLALEEGLQLAATYARYGHGESLRNTAMDRLSDHIGDPEIERLFISLLTDPDWRVRRRVAGTLGEKAWSDAAIGALLDCAKTDIDPYPRDAMESAANAIRDRRKKAEQK